MILDRLADGAEVATVGGATSPDAAEVGNVTPAASRPLAIDTGAKNHAAFLAPAAARCARGPPATSGYKS